MRLALGAEVLRRRRVYLDTCFWIRLRDQLAGASKDHETSELLEILLDGVAADHLICPLEKTLVIETFKQTDPTSRQATARAFDRLSQGICLAAPEERRRAELLFFLRKFNDPTALLHDPRELVWTRVGEVFGAVVPENPAWTTDERRSIQIGHTEYAWGLGVEDVLAVPGWDAEAPLPELAALVIALNEGKVEHQDDGRSIERLRSIEVRGGLDAILHLLRDGLVYLFEVATGRQATEEEREKMSYAQDLAAIIASGYRNNPLWRDLPSLTIPARLHAGLRWDRSRVYRENDLLDFWHAAAALPYCDVFLTDRDLAATITAGHVGLDRLFGCRVTASVKEALGILRTNAKS